MKQELYNNFLISYLEEIDSTNSYLKKLAFDGNANEFSVIVAKKQTAGRGRKSRKWQSYEENLQFSVLLKPAIKTEFISQLSLLSALALVNSLKEFNEKSSKIDISCKWPNDVIINNKKIAGILIENQISDNIEQNIILGCGINLEKSPTNTIFPAGNLKNFGIEIDKITMLKIYLDELAKLYNIWLNFGFKNIRDIWLKHAYKINQIIKLNLGEEIITGQFIDIDNFGNMILEYSNKKTNDKKDENKQIRKIEFAEIL